MRVIFSFVTFTLIGMGSPAPSSSLISADSARELGAVQKTLTVQQPATKVLLDNKEIIDVTPVWFLRDDKAPINSDSMRGTGCGVFISESGEVTQTLVTVGTGLTWPADCGGVTAMGRLPVDKGRARLGIIYKIKSPNTDFFPSAVIIVRENGRWHLDENAMSDPRIEKAQRSIPALRRALTPKG